MSCLKSLGTASRFEQKRWKDSLTPKAKCGKKLPLGAKHPEAARRIEFGTNYTCSHSIDNVSMSCLGGFLGNTPIGLPVREAIFRQELELKTV